ncbi:MAG: aminoacyl-histidine dipeptidase [Paludibacteraceae bacterium]|nr:aminoacyl-histidine dipeptidase [Paludibacteraceae bacterium]
MAKTICDLQPQLVWKNFNKLCSVPHPSHHLEKITKVIVDFGKEHGLETIVDKAGNIIIRKPATPGRENAIPVVLQAHMDMVPQKNNDKVHNFETDPIEPMIDGEWVRANGTTLGADNGIGVAAGMAILESKDIQHGPLELFVTADEETGMYGAFGMEPGTLKGNILLNLDSEDFGELYVGCAGGVDANISWKYQGVAAIADDVALKVTIKGLKGGHSGLEINCGRANANKLLFRFLKEVISLYEARLAKVEGGNMRNAIPREAYAVISVPSEEVENIKKLVEEYCDLFNKEYSITENKIEVLCEEIEMPELIIPEEIQDDLVNAITGCPNGVFRMIPAIPDTVETSMNLSIIEANATDISVKCLLRSSVDSKKEELASMVESVFTLAGAKVEFSGSYSGWNPNLDSTILNTMKEVYKQEFGEEAAVKVIHAGLECGILGAIEPKLDMVSFGPTIRHPHSPDEKINIESVGKFWKLLVATLEHLK